MSTPLELTHTLIRDGVYESYYTDGDTTYLHSDDGRRALIRQFKGLFTAARNHGPRPRIMPGNFREALEHLSVE